MKDVPELDAATKVDKNEMKMATMLVEQMVTTLGEIDAVDHYHQALRSLIESKIKGKKVVEFEVEDVPRLDIMSALKKSLQASSRKPMVKATPNAAEKKKALTLVTSEAKPVAKQRKRKAS
jgi:non-homologous end joining protein Ku